MKEASPPPPRMVPCPQCQRPTPYSTANRWRPFCSERCRLIDLGQWSTGNYRIPTEDDDELSGN